MMDVNCLNGPMTWWPLYDLRGKRGDGGRDLSGSSEKDRGGWRGRGRARIASLGTLAARREGRVLEVLALDARDHPFPDRQRALGGVRGGRHRVERTFQSGGANNASVVGGTPSDVARPRRRSRSRTRRVTDAMRRARTRTSSPSRVRARGCERVRARVCPEVAAGGFQNGRQFWYRLLAFTRVCGEISAWHSASHESRAFLSTMLVAFRASDRGARTFGSRDRNERMASKNAGMNLKHMAGNLDSKCVPPFLRSRVGIPLPRSPRPTFQDRNAGDVRVERIDRR